MDQELIAYLDERFRGIDKRFNAVDERFNAVDERFNAVDERFNAIDERFRETTQQIQDLRQETVRRFDEVHATIRQTDVKLEGLRGDIKLVAEGVAMTNEKLDLFREDVAREFEETREFNRSSYRDLDRRVKDLSELKEPCPPENLRTGRGTDTAFRFEGDHHVPGLVGHRRRVELDLFAYTSVEGPSAVDASVRHPPELVIAARTGGRTIVERQIPVLVVGGHEQEPPSRTCLVTDRPQRADRDRRRRNELEILAHPCRGGAHFDHGLLCPRPFGRDLALQVRDRAFQPRLLGEQPSGQTAQSHDQRRGERHRPGAAPTLGHRDPGGGGRFSMRDDGPRELPFNRRRHGQSLVLHGGWLDRREQMGLDIRPGRDRLQLGGNQPQHLDIEARERLGGLRGLAGNKRLSGLALQRLQHGQDGAFLGGEILVHSSSLISERRAPRSFFMASSVRVLTVPSGTSARAAISLCERPS